MVLKIVLDLKQITVKIDYQVLLNRVLPLCMRNVNFIESF